jgi:GNAT superfamily N-acetyltransferase
MTKILHFRRQLFGPPDVADVAGFIVRNIVVPDDIAAWLELRDRAMADQIPHVRPWSRSDFQMEMSRKSWWSAKRSWVAVDPVTRRSPPIGANSGECVIAAVTLALREGSDSTVPVVHWLLVDPAYRRLGVGRLLMTHLELAAWNDGWREIELETHAGWLAAVEFYQSIGYAPVRARSPR